MSPTETTHLPHSGYSTCSKGPTKKAWQGSRGQIHLEVASPKWMILILRKQAGDDFKKSLWVKVNCESLVFLLSPRGALSSYGRVCTVVLMLVLGKTQQSAF